MKRNFQLIRKMLLAIESDEEPDDDLTLHLRLLREANLLTLTAEGKDFISKIIEEKAWDEANEKIANAGLSPSYWLLREALRSMIETKRIFDESLQNIDEKRD